MADDETAVAMDEMRERYASIGQSCGVVAEVIGRMKCSADDVPCLLAALDEVLAITNLWAQFGDSSERFACAEVREAISRNLTLAEKP